MSKPTPGPWAIGHSQHLRRSVFTAGNGHKRIGTADLSEADARLIAAAPELLEALRSLVSRDFAYYGGFVMDCNITTEEVQRARAAIAKTEGA